MHDSIVVGMSAVSALLVGLIAREESRTGPGDAILIPSGTWHTIMATEPLRFLCCCAPPYSHEDTYFE